MKEILKKAYLLFLLLPLLAIYITGCGEANPAAPSGAVITINPPSFELTTGDTLPVTWRTQYFKITVYENSTKTKTMSDITISIDFVFANPAERYYVQLYHNGERVQSPLTVKTDKYGTYWLRVDFMSGGGTAFEGQINVRSASAFVSADFTVDSE